MFPAICLSAFLLALPVSPSPADAPKVELDFTSMGALDWEGKRFNEIVPADQIKRIVRLRESGFARGSDAPGDQADYDALFVHLLDSTVPATGWALGGNEGTQAELVILTKEGDILRVEVTGTFGTPSSPTAILGSRQRPRSPDQREGVQASRTEEVRAVERFRPEGAERPASLAGDAPNGDARKLLYVRWLPVDKSFQSPELGSSGAMADALTSLAGGK